MANYSIREVEHLSGIKAHTLRIWEQRYEILNPERTDSNIRAYTNEDLKLILNLAMLTKHGYRIGKVAKLPKEEIRKKIDIISKNGCRYECRINALTKAMIDLDEERFEKSITTCVLQNGFEGTMLRVIYPFLEKIGLMWMTGSIRPVQEHFIANLIRQKLIVAIDGQVHQPTLKTKKIILFLPEYEQHELSLLFLHYLLKVRNHKVYYLGSNIPVNNVIEITKYLQPDYLYMVLTSTGYPCRTKKYIGKLSQKLAKFNILASGQALEQHIPSKLPNVHPLTSLSQVLKFINYL